MKGINIIISFILNMNYFFNFLLISYIKNPPYNSVWGHLLAYSRKHRS
jgi:hypothetical protein